MKDLRKQLKDAQKDVREMKLLLDMFKTLPKEQRDKAQLMAAEKKVSILLLNYLEIYLKIPWKRNKSLVWTTQSGSKNHKTKDLWYPNYSVFLYKIEMAATPAPSVVEKVNYCRAIYEFFSFLPS